MHAIDQIAFMPLHIVLYSRDNNNHNHDNNLGTIREWQAYSLSTISDTIHESLFTMSSLVSSMYSL